MYGWSELTKRIDRWVGDHLGRHDSAEYARYLDRVDHYRAIKKIEKLKAHGDGRTEFGMSKAGACTRAASLDKLGFEPTPFSAGTRWTFEIGGDMEASAYALLEAVGFEIVTIQSECLIEGVMRSWSDGIVTAPADLGGKTFVLSVKSTSYKGSMKQRGKWIRRGFPELPFEGIRRSQPTWWAQDQFETYALKMPETLHLVLAKDMIGSMEDDPYLIESGSTFAYTEIIASSPDWVEKIGLPIWRKVAADVKAGAVSDGYVLNRDTLLYAKLDHASNEWAHNAEAAGGTFNFCAYCQHFENCAVVTRGTVESRMTSRTARYGAKTKITTDGAVNPNEVTSGATT